MYNLLSNKTTIGNFLAAKFFWGYPQAIIPLLHVSHSIIPLKQISFEHVYVLKHICVSLEDFSCMVFFVAINRYYMKIGCGLIKKCVNVCRYRAQIVFVLMHLFCLIVRLSGINLPSFPHFHLKSSTQAEIKRKYGQLVFKVYSNAWIGKWNNFWFVKN